MGRQEINPINEGQCLGLSLGSIGVSAIEIKVGTSRVSDRRGVYIKNTTDVVLKWGFDSATCVFPLTAESSVGKGDGGDIWIDVGDQQPLYIVAVSGSGKTAAIAELR